MEHSDIAFSADRNRLMFELSVYLHTIMRKLADNEVAVDTSSKILFVLQMQQPTSLKNLCDILGVTPSAGSILVNKYVRMNLIERRTDSRDRRKIVLSLTKNGTELVNQYTENLYQNLNNSLNFLSEDENLELYSALCLVSHYIQKIHFNS